MEAVSTMADFIRSAARSTLDFIDGFPFPHFLNHPHRRNPIEILKRLQREAFSDLTKLRDRQDKVERVLSLYKSSQATPFQDSQTRVRGEVDALGAFILVGNAAQHHQDAVDRAGIKPGIFSRFIFSTTVGENDNLQVELVSKPNEAPFNADSTGAALSISKVSYATQFSDWLTAIVVPTGAQCKDIALPNHANLLSQRKGLTNLSSLGPPLLNDDIGAAICITLKRNNIVASAGQSFSTAERSLRDEEQVLPPNFVLTSGTFGEIVYKLKSGFELSLLGRRRQGTKPFCHPIFGYFVFPARFLRRNASHNTTQRIVEEQDQNASPNGVFAIKLESPSDMDTRISAWIEQQSLRRKNLKWAVNIFTDVDDGSGWGFGVAGSCGNSEERRLQAESFMKWNLNQKFCIQPGVVYAVEGSSRMLSFMVRSNWCL